MNKTVNINEITNGATVDLGKLTPPRASLKHSNISEAQIEKLWDAVTDMEVPLREVTDFLQGLFMIAINLDEESASPIMTIAAKAKDLCIRLEEERGLCFHTLHKVKFGEKQTVADEVTA
ncbi:hypothetical protein [Ahrensia kielensis]|uniref:hypothetical protein n=1 Tax=Ahrensia kielensis TaxID=76980 RepID=UPI000376C9E6|nr:hypothetical protein [Ahrensia kielensis]